MNGGNKCWWCESRWRMQTNSVEEIWRHVMNVHKPRCRGRGQWQGRRSSSEK